MAFGSRTRCFPHVKRLPELVAQLFAELPRDEIVAIGASTRPRAVEGSYMPCFLAGESQARNLATVLDVPFYAFSHQQGHIAAACWSSGRMDLMDTPHLAWHLSGGTTWSCCSSRRKQERKRRENRRHAGYFRRAALSTGRETRSASAFRREKKLTVSAGNLAAASGLRSS